MREVALDDDAALGEAELQLCGSKDAVRWGQFQRVERARGLAAALILPQTHRLYRCQVLTAMTLLLAGSSLASAAAAAAALLGDGGQGGGILSSPCASGSAGCATAVTLQFVNRPEWLQAGARLILRDQGDGCAAGAGIVRELHWGVMPPSARDAAGDGSEKLRPTC